MNTNLVNGLRKYSDNSLAAKKDRKKVLMSDLRKRDEAILKIYDLISASQYHSAVQQLEKYLQEPTLSKSSLLRAQSLLGACYLNLLSGFQESLVFLSEHFVDPSASGVQQNAYAAIEETLRKKLLKSQAMVIMAHHRLSEEQNYLLLKRALSSFRKAFELSTTMKASGEKIQPTLAAELKTIRMYVKALELLDYHLQGNNSGLTLQKNTHSKPEDRS